MDEISLGAATLVGELRQGEILEYELHPEDFGMSMMSHRSLRVDNPQASRAMLMQAIEAKPGAAFEIVCLNAGAALYTAGRVDSIASGLALARETLRSGAALAKLHEMVALTQRLGAHAA